ncbi:LysR family transcriptional regulator [Comamonas composti]|uniref:LysR family transcriptional regulator n=1 Tax=Comamonas composti TaxID=408558 RepID=UPI0004156177|nr:LysR family transcriptional regulator [Comamonas composti]
MELRQLRYFLVLAEELHFSRAAQRLAISQPPLSVAIRQLEDELGAQLFERSSKEVRLTAAGAHLREQAQSIMDQTQRVKQDMRAMGQGLRGRIRLGFVGSSVYRGLPEALKSFAVEHPLVRIDMLELNSAEQALALQQGRLDLGLLHATRAPAGLQAHTLVIEPFLACLPAEHALAGQDRLQVAQLAHERLVLFSREVSPDYHEQIWQICHSAGFAPDLRHEVRHWLSVLSLVSLGQGVSLVPACLQRVNFPGLVFIPIAGDHPLSQMQAMWLPGPAQPLLESLLTHIRASISQLQRKSRPGKTT